MQFEVVVFLSFMSFLAYCNRTGNYEGLNMEYKTRQHRLLTFNTEEGGDVSVELAFNVPFVRIPVKKSVDSVKGAVANINMGAVALTGGIVLAAVGLLPVISWLSSKTTYGSFYNYRNSHGSIDYSQSLKLLNEFLVQKNLEPVACLQKLFCWSVKRSMKKIRNGKGASVDKIIDGLASSEWMKYILNEIGFLESVEEGVRGSNCGKLYSTCSINKLDLEVLANDLFSDID